MLTPWDSLEAIRPFAGANLVTYDSTVTHHAVVCLHGRRQPRTASESAVAELVREVGQSPLCLTTTSR